MHMYIHEYSVPLGGKGSLVCVVCAHACSLCAPLLCVCVTRGQGPHPPCHVRICLLVCVENLSARLPRSPESHLSHHPFPLHFLLLLCKQPVAVNCHLGSQIRIFAPDGVGRGS